MYKNFLFASTSILTGSVILAAVRASKERCTPSFSPLVHPTADAPSCFSPSRCDSELVTKPQDKTTHALSSTQQTRRSAWETRVRMWMIARSGDALGGALWQPREMWCVVATLIQTNLATHKMLRQPTCKLVWCCVQVEPQIYQTAWHQRQRRPYCSSSALTAQSRGFFCASACTYVRAGGLWALVFGGGGVHCLTFQSRATITVHETV